MKRVLFLLLAVCLPHRAWAFSVEDHRALTEAALKGSRAGAHRDSVLHGATAEDINLHVKWTGWHHFYQPEGHFDSALRQGSDVRVRDLWDEALEAARHGDMPRAWDRAGHLAHHIQDMASPPHVVPVNHALSDGFEAHGLQGALSRLPARELPPLPGPDAHHALARETLDVVRSQSLTTRDGTAVPWSAFWSEPSAEDAGDFGAYGPVGNAFGQARLRWKGRTRRADSQAYAAFMDARAAAAVAYTRAFLEWAAARFEEASAPDAPVLASRGFRPPPELSFQLLGGLTRDPRGTVPLMGLRASLPLPHALGLSVDWTRGLGTGSRTQPLPAGGWTFSVLSPPLWTGRPGYPAGLDLRTTVGLGLVSWEGGSRFGVPVGLRAHAALGRSVILSSEVQYQGFSPPGGKWAHGFTWTVGAGVALGDW